MYMYGVSDRCDSRIRLHYFQCYKCTGVNTCTPHTVLQVVNKLKALYGDMYTTDNVLISGIHTHSGPAGFFQYLLFEVTCSVISYVLRSPEIDSM